MQRPMTLLPGGTYEQAAEWLKVLKAERKGLGFVLTLDGGNGCIDIDHCLDSSTRKFKDDEAGKTAARVMEILTREGVEPCSEVSQSGEGLHIWGKFDLPPEKVKGIRNKYIEMYCWALYRHDRRCLSRCRNTRYSTGR